jgi:hypothetical protein
MDVYSDQGQQQSWWQVRIDTEVTGRCSYLVE